MTFVPAAQLAVITTLQYMKRSCRTLHVPAGKLSQDAKLSSMAMRASASSAASSKSKEYAVALMASVRPEKSGWNVQKASRTACGESPSALGTTATVMCCSQYHSQISDSSIESLHPVVCTPDGRGHPAHDKGESAGRGGAIMRALMRGANALDDHWIGDVISVVSLFVGCWMLLVLGYGVGLQ